MSSEPRPDLQARLQEAVRGAIAGVMHEEITRRSCISCVHFKEPEVLCNLYKQIPPPRIVAYGCNEYMDNLGVPY